MNTRLQVEHTVTEMVTGLDLVALQIEVALGESVAGLDGRAARPRDPVPDQRRGPGPQLPAGPRAHHALPRARRPVRAGRLRRRGRPRTSPGDYDSMFAKLIVSGADREQARRRMLRALDEFVVEGVPTTIPVHRWVLESEDFLDGHAHDHVAREALADAGTCPRQATSPGAVRATGAAAARHPGRGRRPPRAGPRSSTSGARPRRRRPRSHSGHHGEHVHGEIRAPMQGTIVKVLVEKGQEVQAGDVVCILEAMKMENHIAMHPRGRGQRAADPAPARSSRPAQVLAVID